MANDNAEAIRERVNTTESPAARKKSVKPTAKGETKKPAVTPKPAPPKSKMKKVACDFSLPRAEYERIAQIKAACLEAGLPVKKSEILRAGLKVLSEMNGKQIIRAIEGLAKKKAESA